MSRMYIIPVFIPHKGCKKLCVFCNQRKISGQIQDVEGSNVRDIIEEYLAINNEIDYKKIQVAFFGGSFTGIEKEKQIEFLKIAKEYIDAKKIDSIRLSTRPDYINDEILTYLKEYCVKTIELGVQSLNEEVLEASKRGHNIECVLKSSELIKKYGFELGIQTMLGLPKSNKKREIETAEQVVEINPSIVRIYPTLVIKNTDLEKQYRNNEYIPYTVDEAVDISAEILELYNKNNINVIRIGLQNTDNINEQEDVIAGPFHPSFGELVKQRVFRNKIEEKIKDCNFKRISIICNKKDISKIIGNKKENIIYFKQKYNIDIIVKQDIKYQEGNFDIKEGI